MNALCASESAHGTTTEAPAVVIQDDTTEAPAVVIQYDWAWSDHKDNMTTTVYGDGKGNLLGKLTYADSNTGFLLNNSIIRIDRKEKTLTMTPGRHRGTVEVDVIHENSGGVKTFEVILH
jgi:hypothetical protein